MDFFFVCFLFLKSLAITVTQLIVVSEYRLQRVCGWMVIEIPIGGIDVLMLNISIVQVNNKLTFAR